MLEYLKHLVYSLFSSASLPEEIEESVDLSVMKKAELLEYAAANGIKVNKSDKKSILISKIKGE